MQREPPCANSPLERGIAGALHLQECVAVATTQLLMAKGVTYNGLFLVGYMMVSVIHSVTDVIVYLVIRGSNDRGSEVRI
ncbi:hypothetical protein JOQ06_005233 [Pogonophryne albipinna]|uniref:Uncharacterized protein n=1 Tax=Pogonophryne albipinna TaxID=1090488 RepID=A0AAD6BFU3_9TELE|nr:hypothetical protein JOQ06_005233 [Pogonophryne albipinna]